MTAGAVLPNPGPTWHVDAAADFNGDGKADILWQNDSGLPAIWTMDGTNITGAAALPNPGPPGMSLQRPISTATASPTSFGRTTTARRRSGRWMAPTSPVRRSLPNPGPTWHVAAAGDFNGDGKADILWQNDNGTPAIWTMDGTNITGAAALPNPGPTLACRCSGRFQRRRQGRHPVAERQRLAGDLDHGRHQHHRLQPSCPIRGTTGTYSRAISLALSRPLLLLCRDGIDCRCSKLMPYRIRLQQIAGPQSCCQKSGKLPSFHRD